MIQTKLAYNNCLPPPLIRPAKRGTFSQREKGKPPPLWGEGCGEGSAGLCQTILN